MKPSPEQIAAALEFYGLGPVAGECWALVAVEVELITEHVVEFRPLGLPTVREAMRSQVTLFYYSASRAVIKLPHAMLTPLRLEGHELTGSQMVKAMERVAEHNALYPTRPRATERVGNIAI